MNLYFLYYTKYSINSEDVMNDKIIKALNWRYATQTFDPTKKVDEKDMDVILESARLAPSSFGIEPWHFFVVENQEIRKRLHDEASPQPKVVDASHFVVIAKRTDAREAIAAERVSRTAKTLGAPEEAFKGLGDMISGVVGSRDDTALDLWVNAQTYIPLGMMIETAALLGVDAGPMEGFDHDKFDEILGLKEQNLASVSAIGFGYRGDDEAATRPKVRRDSDDVITWLK